MGRWRSKLNRARCPRCSRVVAVLVPAGGDGSAEVFRKHTDEWRSYCLGTGRIVEDEEYVRDD